MSSELCAASYHARGVDPTFTTPLGVAAAKLNFDRLTLAKI